MKSHFVILMVPFLMFSASCKKDPEGPKQPVAINLPAKGDAVVAKNNEFGINLFRTTALAEDKNLMLSPLSASTALTMLLNGCNTATYEQVRDMLGYEGLTTDEINEVYKSLVTQLLAADPEVQLALANAVWYRQDFQVKPPFLESMDASFDAEIAALDFFSPSALTTINNWAKDNTNGKIEKVLDEISPDAVMFLMNALYFKGNWTYQFKKDQTADAPFYPENGNMLNVKTMRSQIPVKIHNGSRAIAAEMPYGRQNFAMVLILPEGKLSDFLPGFDGQEWAEITAGLDAIQEPSKVEMVMPKFKFDFEKILNDQLKELGMIDAFNPYQADLSGISDQQIFVSFVKQNTFVDVNEEGTEAAAVTTIGIDLTSLPSEFVVNKPFIFAIRERMTNSLLFIGKVERPEY
ncbi:MAG: serpin family protein [Bacteroidales bacterium]|nr:serpin family protein [Bacteroidales bacterium]